jgi:integral membrane protein
MTTAAGPAGPVGARPDRHAKALLAYRILAFATGIVLVLATIGLIVQVSGHESIKDRIGLVWVLHGYLYLAYVIATVNLGLKLRWGFVRMAVVALAGTIPTMSFVAEHVVTRDVRATLAGRPPVAARPRVE